MDKLEEIDYETMSQEEVDRQLREAGYDPRLVGKYYQLLADYTVLQAKVDAQQEELGRLRARVAELEAYIDEHNRRALAGEE